MVLHAHSVRHSFFSSFFFPYGMRGLECDDRGPNAALYDCFTSCQAGELLRRGVRIGRVQSGTSLIVSVIRTITTSGRSPRPRQ